MCTPHVLGQQVLVEDTEFVDDVILLEQLLELERVFLEDVVDGRRRVEAERAPEVHGEYTPTQDGEPRES